MNRYFPATLAVDLDAIDHNFQQVADHLNGQKVMAIVKANAYGHGREAVARQALASGADYLGVAQIGEAIQLREALSDLTPQPRITAWVITPDVDFIEVLEAHIEVSIGAFWSLEALARAAAELGVCAPIHIEVDTGMARGGFAISDARQAFERAHRLEREGHIRVVGLWSHLARADELDAAGRDFTSVQVASFERLRAQAAAAGLDIELHHLAASSGVFWHPEALYDMVRPGAVLYGISPNTRVASASELNLRAAMQFSASVMQVRDVPAGTGISYGHTAVVDHAAHIAVIPVGYADGIPRHASNCGPVTISGQRTHVLGRVCMDQFMVQTQPEVKEGDRAVLFGDAHDGYATADDWADLSGTIGYEVTTALSLRIPRVYYRSKHGTEPLKYPRATRLH
ncbi:MAG: alanine racemase [Actinomycetaceae bacterium]|nr:alanine racemase [Actinomycetaceae bacterium]MDY6082872.1 alanine racemase [Actinomycetaceae bacterium]